MFGGSMARWRVHYHWTRDEERYLIDNYGRMTCTTIRRHVHRPLGAIYAKARALGLRKREPERKRR
jgi:hypothetical protein